MRKPHIHLLLRIALGLGAALAASTSLATGLATCDSGPRSGWQSAEILKTQLEAKGWKIRRIKIDGGCYEVYAIDDRGERVEAYFHPVTFARVPTARDE